MATSKIQTGVRFEPEMLYKLSFIAKQKKRSMNAQMEYIVQEYIQQYEKEHGEIPINEEDLPV